MSRLPVSPMQFRNLIEHLAIAITLRPYDRDP